MYGKVVPDSLGRPSLVWISAHAAQVMGDGPWQIEVEGRRLIFRASPGGRKFGRKMRSISAGALLDDLNDDGNLTNEPFPIRHRKTTDGVQFEFLVREPDAALSSRGAQRNTALPMRLVGVPVIQKQAHSTEEFVRLFALATLVQGETIDEAAFRDAPDDLLARLPAYNTVLARFGSWRRFAAFVEFQVGKLRRARMNAQEAFQTLDAMLEA